MKPKPAMISGSRMPAGTVERVIALRKLGLNAKQIAERMAISYDVAGDIIREHRKRG